LTQYLLIGITLVWFRERAFIFGWAVSHILFAPVFARYMLNEMKLPRSLFWGQLARHAIVAAMLVALVTGCKNFLDPHNLIELVVVGAVNCIVAWALGFAIILTRDERAMFGRFARTMRSG
jgi:hypothetical protein